MSNDTERSGIERLWSGGGTREKPARPEPQPLPADPIRADTMRQVRQGRSYVAFEAREHAQRLHICCAAQASHYPAYSSLLNIIHDHDFEKGFTLVYSFMLVEVTGARLGAIVRALSDGNCGRITEYHRKLHDPPPPGAPVIDSIKITAAIGGSGNAL